MGMAAAQWYVKSAYSRLAEKRWVYSCGKEVGNMEIIIGSVPPLGGQNRKPQEKNVITVQGELLHARQPRKGIAGPSGMERRGRRVKDPVKGRVLTVMIPDGSTLPADLDSARYEVVLRLIRK